LQIQEAETERKQEIEKLQADIEQLQTERKQETEELHGELEQLQAQSKQKVQELQAKVSLSLFSGRADEHSMLHKTPSRIGAQHGHHGV